MKIWQKRQRWERRSGTSSARETGSIQQAWERIEQLIVDTGKPPEKIKRFLSAKATITAWSGWRRLWCFTKEELQRVRRPTGSCTNTDSMANSHITTFLPRLQRSARIRLTIRFFFLSFFWRVWILLHINLFSPPFKKKTKNLYLYGYVFSLDLVMRANFQSSVSLHNFSFLHIYVGWEFPFMGVGGPFFI